MPMRCVVCVLLSGPLLLLAQPRELPAPAERPAVVRCSSAGAAPAARTAVAARVLALDFAELAAHHRDAKPLVISGVDVGDRVLELVLQPFSVTGPHTRFVVGSRSGQDRLLDFDPDRIAMFRGTVRGHPGSHVFLSVGPWGGTGSIELGAGAPRYWISAPAAQRRAAAAGSDRLIVFQAAGQPDLPPGVPWCGVIGHAAGSESLELRRRPRGVVPPAGIRHLELAVETDFEFFERFGALDEAAAYLVQLYGQVSAVYLRDVDTRVELVYARLWDQPDDLFNVVNPSPLMEFAGYWNANMAAVQRDAAQLLSGRRDYPFGGQAYLSALCGGLAYSVVGYAMGFFPDPSMPSPYHYDIGVTAHELGHNCGTGHTHDLGIDSCDDPATTPQRGTIMSYCGQTWSGGNANTDHYFHSGVLANMNAHLGGASCVVPDCDMNGIDDATDILIFGAVDSNGNAVPDTCEDCNGNGTLDDADITSATSADVNGNLVPDDCEPDCNGNGAPDSLDISLGASSDAYGNGIPDECEADCNRNGTSDYTEIQLDMGLDIDRNAVLDACQDCDGDGVTDLQALAGGHNLWIASGLAGDVLREFHGRSGVLVRASGGGAAGVVHQGQDVLVVPGGRVLVSSAADNRVLQFSLDGTYLGDLVTAGSGGLAFPTGLAWLPGGTLLVASRNTDRVLAYDGFDGSPQGAFVAAGSGGLVAPAGLTLGPAGNLFVSDGANQVLEYDGVSGVFVGVRVSAVNNGGLDQPRGLVFKPDGNLLVTSYGGNETLEFDGASGAPLGKWAQVGTAAQLTQISPWGIRVGPNGNVFVVRTGEAFGSDPGAADHDDHDHSDVAGDHHDELHLTNAQIYEFDARSGLFLRTLIGGNDHGLLFPTGFAFVPGWALDCNLNALPDSCDVAAGGSPDVDGSGVPDECEVDCNGNGILDRLDLIPFGPETDCNANAVPDSCDLRQGESVDLNGNGRPDECDPDCNFNHTPDDLEIAGGAPDCDADGVPDDCQLLNGDCDGNGTLDECQNDCDRNGVPDVCEGLILFADDFEQDRGWTVEVLRATSGQWQRGTPVDDSGWVYDPPADGDGSGQCYLTQNERGNSDVDNGAVLLVSPTLDLSMGGVTLEYLYYLRLGTVNGGDVLRVDLNANDGVGPWIEVASHTVDGGLLWRSHAIGPSDLAAAGVALTATMRVRFVAIDGDPQSVVEAGVDGFAVTAFGADTQCDCPADLSGDGVVNAVDLAQLLGAWGPNPRHAADLNGDGGIDATDLAVLLGAWGPCP